MHTVRCGFGGIPTVRFGAVFRKRKTYGAVLVWFQTSENTRCGAVRFSETRKPTVRFGAIFRYRKTYGVVRCGFQEGKRPTIDSLIPDRETQGSTRAGAVYLDPLLI